MTDTTANSETGPLQGRRIAIVGRLAGMSRRDAARLLRRAGAVVVERSPESADLIALGEHEPLLAEVTDPIECLDSPLREAVISGRAELVSESKLWSLAGLIDGEAEIDRLYTPAMLADLLDISPTIVRRWHRRGLIRPVREVRRLPYFDFREVMTAKRLADLLDSGLSPRTIEKKLSELAPWMPDVGRSLDQLSIMIQGRRLLTRSEDGLVDADGQLHFDLEAHAPPVESTDDTTVIVESETSSLEPAQAVERMIEQISPADDSTDAVSKGSYLSRAVLDNPEAPDQLRMAAGDLEAADRLPEAAEMYRAALAAGGPDAEICFELADVLYRMGQIEAARERYYMAIELDENFVEARVNLGCVLRELGQIDLAVAAFYGALAFHRDYADARYHLARIFDQLENMDRAAEHWRAFLEIAPDSPWAQQARVRLDLPEDDLSE